MKILWASNAPWAPTGYGGQTKLLIRRLKDAGHEVAVAANFGLQAAVADAGGVMADPAFVGIPVLPGSYDAYGNDILPAHFVRWTDDQPGYLITLYDVWPYARERFREFPVASWTPIDHDPAPPEVVAWAREHETIAMSHYGQAALATAGVTSTYIPHAIDRTVFRPLDRAEARAAVRWPDDKFVVLINAANKGSIPSRKAFNEMFGALAVFLRAHPDVVVHMHSEATGFQSPQLDALAHAWDIPGDRLAWTHPYAYKAGLVKDRDLALFYSGADVLLATSMGEGFGIPVIEAQACGTPVIVSDFSAQPELVGAGWTAPVQRWWDQAQGAFLGTPLIDGIIAALEAAYVARGSAELRAAAVAKSAEYDIETVWPERWLPYLAHLEETLRPKLSRRERRARKAA